MPHELIIIIIRGGQVRRSFANPPGKYGELVS